MKAREPTFFFFARKSDRDRQTGWENLIRKTHNLNENFSDGTKKL